MGRRITRPQGKRIARTDLRDRRLESLAAEFALLAQRKARVAHQVDLLDQQRDAAAGSLAAIQGRMAWLTQRMAAVTPEPRAAVVVMPSPPIASPVPKRVYKPRLTDMTTRLMPGSEPGGAPVADGRWLASRRMLQQRQVTGKWRT